ncbi:hypothetical protein PAMC26510_17140 [Caballeronia sordidicola]|uniref:Uncharacterized protein n=1 Tax=Caballeronia sordidicola TaxID=196367 RepID=A0A2C9XV73_CABSO|nr:hypothetical protein PAMC26510_17140 [Caballeronia sordidicola]
MTKASRLRGAFSLCGGFIAVPGSWFLFSFLSTRLEFQ